MFSDSGNLWSFRHPIDFSSSQELETQAALFRALKYEHTQHNYNISSNNRDHILLLFVPFPSSQQ